MIRWVVGSSLKFRRVVVVVALGVIVVGVAQLRNINVEALPEFNPTIVEVQTEALGLSAPEVEQLITVPLEQDLLNGVAFLDDIESISMPGLSSISMTFEPGTPLLDARQVVEERLTQAHALPQVSKPPQMLQPLSSTSRVQMVRLSSQQLNPIEVSVLARWVIVPRLLGVDGVANVAIWGQRDRQLQVQVDPARLAAAGVTLQQVINTTGNALEFSPLSYLEASTPGTGGFIETLNQRIQIFHEQTINTPAELAQVPLEDAEGGVVRVDDTPLALGQITTVVEDHQPLIGDAFCPRGDCVLLVVEKFPGANTTKVTDGVEGALDLLRPGLGDMELDPSIYRPATVIESSFETIGWRVAIGLGLLVLVLAIFFRNWRTTLLSVFAIVTSLAAAALVLAATGTTVNLLMLVGLIVALGAVVDDAVADSHHLARRVSTVRAGMPDAPILRVAAEAALEMRKAIFCAVLVGVAAMVPVFGLGSEAGTLFPPAVRGYVLAIGLAMLVALTVTPALGALVLGRGSSPLPEPAGFRWLSARHGGVVRRTLARGALPLAAVVALTVVGVALLPTLDRMIRPSLEHDLLVDVEAAPGTSLTQLANVISGAVNQVDAIPGVLNVGAHVGRAIASDQLVNVNSGEMWISLDPDAGRDAVDQIQSTLRRLPGVEASLRTYWDKRLLEVLRAPSEDLVVRVYGENAQVRREKAEEIRQVIGEIDGVDETEVLLPAEEATIQVEVDLARARAAGLKPGDVRREITTLLSGITVGNLFEEQKVFDVIVWGVPEIRRNVDNIANLQIDAPDGRRVRVGDVANVRTVQAPTEIRHESVFSYLDVTASVDGRSSHEIAQDVDASIKAIRFPLEHHAELLERFDDQQEARQEFLIYVALAVVAGFLLLQAAFSSWRLAALAFLTLPVSVVGGVLLLWATGIGLTVGSIAGLLAVFALAVRHAVVLIRRYQHLERVVGMPFGDELVLRGSEERLAPIVIATLGTAVLQVPFLFATSTPGIGLVRPAAVAILGGLITSLLLTLVLLPALYRRYGFVARPDLSGEELFMPSPDRDETAWAVR
ncbi:MAG: efflux RND transporter permease subunit [Acidimicrobiales bacterium]